tara:strand:- start:187 stop:588 length:402 start_codon:yes stop_codon:yes gene_type:complete
MKPSEFKKILKPLVMQTVKEVLLQEGVLSNIVSEVAKGLGGNTITESRRSDPKENIRLKEQEYEKQRQTRIKKLNESNKFGDVFSGTKEIVEEKSNTRGAAPLSGVSAVDSGVDIDVIEQLSKGKWKALMGQK